VIDRLKEGSKCRVWIKGDKADYKSGFVYVEWIDAWRHKVRHVKTKKVHTVTTVDILELCLPEGEHM